MMPLVLVFFLHSSQDAYISRRVSQYFIMIYQINKLLDDGLSHLKHREIEKYGFAGGMKILLFTPSGGVIACIYFS